MGIDKIRLERVSMLATELSSGFLHPKADLLLDSHIKWSVRAGAENSIVTDPKSFELGFQTLAIVMDEVLEDMHGSLLLSLSKDPTLVFEAVQRIQTGSEALAKLSSAMEVLARRRV